MYYDNVLISELEDGDHLAHYGVVGMHWGVRKARKYAKDLNQAKRNDEVRKSRLEKNQGKITKKQHKENVKKANARQKARDKKVRQDLSNVKKTNRGVKARTISEPYKNKAYSGIRNYGGKRVARGIERGLTGWWGLSAAITSPVSVALMGYSPAVAIPAAVASATISSIIPHAIGKTVSKKTM